MKEDIFRPHARVPKFRSPCKQLIFLYRLIKLANTEIKANFLYQLQLSAHTKNE
jgi:hypothetical protein